MLDQLVPEPGAFGTIWASSVGQRRRGRFFVIYAPGTILKAQRRYSQAVDRRTGLICDQTVVLTGFYSHKGFGKTLVFLTTNFGLREAIQAVESVRITLGHY